MTKLRLAFPGGDKALIRSRLLSRQGHYMNPALLDSQFAILKPAESGTDHTLSKLTDGNCGLSPVLQADFFNRRRFASDEHVAHQCGTLRFGTDPTHAVLDADCRMFGHDNLFVVDGSFFPSSAAVNPALTIMANALRVGDHLIGRMS